MNKGRISSLNKDTLLGVKMKIVCEGWTFGSFRVDSHSISNETLFVNVLVDLLTPIVGRKL